MRRILLCLVFVLPLTACERRTETSTPRKVAGKAVSPASDPKFHNVLNLRSLMPAKRFGEYGVGERYRAAQDALNAGDVESAYNEFGERDRSLDGPREKRFDDALEIAFQRWSNTTPGSNYAERVQTYWLPDLRALSNTPPTDVTTCRVRLSKLQELIQIGVDGKGLVFTNRESSTVGRFRKELQSKQAVLLPTLQRQCG